ncbi:MAG: terminase, partial [Muribaculaceae bacterium]|nr:terminase [Muribaculaceae bacterium]
MQDSKITDENLINQVLKEDARRRRELQTPYDPETGALSPGSRFAIRIPELGSSAIHIPVAMQETPEVKALMAGHALTRAFPGSADDARRHWHELRCRYDFPYWAFKCIKIKSKTGGRDFPFLLNAPQRKLIGAFEAMREAGEPIRIILVKARQWGGSTATQIYMLWIQLMRREGFNSLIIGQQNTGTEEVMAMAKRALDQYPRELLQGDGDPMPEKEKVYVNTGLSRTTISIPRRNFRIKAGSAERPDAVRGGDYALVHLTEVGLWKKTQGKKPEDIMRAATSGVLLYPETMIVMESTANGVGTFFHREYLAAKRGTSLYRPVFVAWYEIDKYSDPVADRRRMAERIVRDRNCGFSDDPRIATGQYIWGLWEAGASLDAINWYEKTRAGLDNTDNMASEYPSDDDEAFVNSGAHV